MDYGGLEFMRLTDEVEAQGGEHLDVLHERRTMRIPKQAEKGEAQRLASTGCGSAAIFSIPYERCTFGGSPTTDQQIDTGEREDLEPNSRRADGNTAYMAMPINEEDAMLVVCAEDDNVGLWPRFIGSWEDDD